ncbi:MAG: alpha/beta fold hydrolase [Vibrionaceae bacterium]
MVMQQQYPVICDREIHVRIWNPQAKETVFCLHGFTHNSADFLMLGDELASQGFRVIAPDLIGRGLSQWATNPVKEYNFAFYAQLLGQLLEHYRCESVHWVGCDMGGLLGILLASQTKFNFELQSLILNDAAPEVSPNALENIIKKSKTNHFFAHLEDLSSFLASTSQQMNLNNDYWDQLVFSYARRLAVGGFTLHYDSKLLLDEQIASINMWHHFRKLKVPVLLMSSSRTALVNGDVIKQMRSLLPELKVMHLLGCDSDYNLFFKPYCHSLARFIEEKQKALQTAV